METQNRFTGRFPANDPCGSHGGVAQMARAFGSYPNCRWFDSDRRYQLPGKADVPSAVHRPAGQVSSIRYGPMVKRSRHGPFKAVTGVRFSLGSPQTKRVGICRRVLFLFLAVMLPIMTETIFCRFSVKPAASIRTCFCFLLHGVHPAG